MLAAVTIRVRSAPSPTGELHIGNVRTMLYNHIFARQNKGTVILRVEDTDQERFDPRALSSIYDGLHWLGLEWDEGPREGGPFAPYAQSERGHIYDAHLQRLCDAGLVYPCYCSRADIARAASAPHGAAEEGPRYPGTCRDPAGRERKRRSAGARSPARRCKAPEGTIC